MYQGIFFLEKEVLYMYDVYRQQFLKIYFRFFTRTGLYVIYHEIFVCHICDKF